MNDGEATFIALILAQVNRVSLHRAGSSVLSKTGPLHVNIQVDTEYLAGIAGILAAGIEAEGAAQFDPGRYQPVVGSQSGVGGVVIACRSHAAESAVGLQGALLIVHVLPAVAVTVLIQNGPVVCLSLVLEVPEQGLTALDSVVGGGACSYIKSLQCNAGQYVHVTLLDGHGLALACHSLHFLDTGLNVVDQFVIDTCRCAQRNCNCNQKYR